MDKVYRNALSAHVESLPTAQAGVLRAIVDGLFLHVDEVQQQPRLDMEPASVFTFRRLNELPQTFDPVRHAVVDRDAWNAILNVLGKDVDVDDCTAVSHAVVEGINTLESQSGEIRALVQENVEALVLRDALSEALTAIRNTIPNGDQAEDLAVAVAGLVSELRSALQRLRDRTETEIQIRDMMGLAPDDTTPTVDALAAEFANRTARHLADVLTANAPGCGGGAIGEADEQPESATPGPSKGERGGQTVVKVASPEPPPAKVFEGHDLLEQARRDKIVDASPEMSGAGRWRAAYTPGHCVKVIRLLAEGRQPKSILREMEKVQAINGGTIANIAIQYKPQIAWASTLKDAARDKYLASVQKHMEDRAKVAA